MDDKNGKTVGILGAGWLGLSLATELRAAGFSVRASARSDDKLTALRKDHNLSFFRVDLPTILPRAFFAGLDYIIITLPPGGRRLGAATTRDYTDRLRSLAPFLRAPSNPKVFFCSSTGVYGEASGRVDELTPVAPTTHSSRAVVAAEALLERMTDRLTILRLAGLVGPDRHPGTFFGGKKFALRQSDAPINLVHRYDVIAAFKLLMARNAPTGVYNVCATAHPPKASFYGAAAGAMNLEIQALEPGGADGKTVDSERLRQLGWQPKHDDLKIFSRT